VILPKGAIEITANQGEVALRTLMNPYLIAAVGREQRIFGGQQVPIPVGGTTQPTGVSQELEVQQNVERHEVGIDMRVKPTVVSAQTIALELQVSVSSVIPPTPVIQPSQLSSGELGPVLRQFELESSIRLVDGAIAVVAVSPQESLDRQVSGVPFLRSIPILGFFFRDVLEIERRRQIIVAVKATRILSQEQLRALTIQRRIGLERVLARTPPLRAGQGEPFGLLVATRTSSAEASDVADAVGSLGGRLEIVEWSASGDARFDVYLVGFGTLAELGPAGRALRERGFDPQVIVVKPEL
jgi:hypothetical protein